MKKLLTMVLALALLLTSVAALAEGEKTHILYSKSQGPYTELFEAAIIPILEAQGYTFEVVETSELLVADQLLQAGEVDVNVEQHTAYANSFNANNGGDLTPISVIPTVAAAVYSANHASLDEIAEGMTVAIPNDASNTARCLAILQKIGWIKLDESVAISAVTVDDVVENPYNLELIEQKSLTIPAAIQDYDYVAITGSVVYNAQVNEKYPALAQEDILEHLILQVVVKAENVDAPWAQAIVAAYHSDEFKAYLDRENAPDGAWKGLWWIPEELK
ncbi:MAG: MetQ/NlpA family ABC transporter substrate-binding protein [bacterium]|nr:MetQ/NlpA family ABC transporter substrate-binding protein [bacterium]